MDSTIQRIYNTGAESYRASLDILQFAAEHTKGKQSAVFLQSSAVRPIFENSKKDHFEKTISEFPEVL